MADNPPPGLIIAEVRKALEAGLAQGFPQKVAANALGIALREIENGPPSTEAQAAALSQSIRSGAADDATLAELVRIVIAKLEIDQPGYPPFKAWKSGLSGAGERDQLG